MKPVVWKQEKLNLGSLRIRASVPFFGVAPSCFMPGPTDEEVGVCQPTPGGADKSVWQIRVVTQRDRFIPVSWFDDALYAMRNSADETLTRRLGMDANQRTGAGFQNAALLSVTQIPGALAIRGAASAPKVFGTEGLQSCTYAFFLSQNRPATVLYCASTDEDSLDGAQKLVRSLQASSPSTEYRRGSATATEHAYYLRKLKSGGGASAAPDLVSAENTYEQFSASECSKYAVLSQERYQCAETLAASRLDQLEKTE
ncbi:hypothetical protein PQR70_37130 [Paraburkholderia madseniana]|uniref:hypothetical protein n=1 Tax=Paraburkholderia madseniana TaxID=2599607 RepID=UPI0038B9E45D